MRMTPRVMMPENVGNLPAPRSEASTSGSTPSIATITTRNPGEMTASGGDSTVADSRGAASTNNPAAPANANRPAASTSHRVDVAGPAVAPTCARWRAAMTAKAVIATPWPSSRLTMTATSNASAVIVGADHAAFALALCHHRVRYTRQATPTNVPAARETNLARVATVRPPNVAISTLARNVDSVAVTPNINAR